MGYIYIYIYIQKRIKQDENNWRCCISIFYFMYHIQPNLPINFMSSFGCAALFYDIPASVHYSSVKVNDAIVLLSS